jgi:hypothetical protein
MQLTQQSYAELASPFNHVLPGICAGVHVTWVIYSPAREPKSDDSGEPAMLGVAQAA